MSIQVEVEDTLLQKVMQSSESASEREAVEEALRFFLRIKAQNAIRELRGKVQWDGDLTEMRRMRNFD